MPTTPPRCRCWPSTDSRTHTSRSFTRGEGSTAESGIRQCKAAACLFAGASCSFMAALLRDFLVQPAVTSHRRPGTPAARMKQLPSEVKKQRSREVTAAVEAWGAEVHQHLVGCVERCCVVDTAADGVHLVAHNKTYAQVGLGGGGQGWGSTLLVVSTRKSVVRRLCLRCVAAEARHAEIARHPPSAVHLCHPIHHRCWSPPRRPMAAAACWAAWLRPVSCLPAAGV